MFHQPVCSSKVRRRGVLLGAVLILLPCWSAAGVAAESGEETSPPLVSNMFFDTNLREVLVDIATQTGEVIIPDMTVQGLVTCELKDVPLEKALLIVLSVGNFTFRRIDGHILVGSSDPDSPSFSKLSANQTVKLDYISAASAINLLPAGARRYANADEETNMVSITAPPEMLDGIADSLLDLDRPPRQVVLEARIVVLSSGKMHELGMQWNWPQVVAGIASGSEQHGLEGAGKASWPWMIDIGSPTSDFTNALMVTLNLLTQNDEATVIASPRVLAQDGKEANISVTTEEYFEILTEGYYQSSQLEKIEAGTILKITPQVEDSGRITMEISAEVSDVVARGVDDLPVVTRRTAQSTLHLEDGGTAVVAGLLDSRSRYERDGVPFLGRIPVIGWLFQSRRASRADRQVAVFVTARLVPENKGTSGGVMGSPTRAAARPAGPEFRRDLQRCLVNPPW